MDACQLFLMNHYHTHFYTPTPGTTISRAEGLYKGLTEADVRKCPFDRHNSIVWLLWHIARCEDVMVNTVLRDVPEVLDNGWLNRLGVSTRHIGTGDTMAEVDAFSQQVDVTELRLYRAAVAQATQKWAERVDFSLLNKVLKCAGAERAAQRGAFSRQGDWVRVKWGAEERSEISWLSSMAIGHNYEHLGEAKVTRSLLEHAEQ